MSMILDALSRAEKERQAENASVLDTEKYVQSSTIKDDRFKKWVLIALVANFVLIVLIGMGIIWKNQHNPNSAQQVNTVQEQPISMNSGQPSMTSQQNPSAISVRDDRDDIFEEVTNLTSDTNKTMPATSLIEETKVATKKISKKSFASSAKKIAVKNPPVKYSSKPLTQPTKAITNENIIASTAKLNSPSLTSSFTKMTDLPIEQRSKLGTYEVNVHVYDDNPQSRFVLINMIKYKEGDSLPGGSAIVSSIIPEGVVIDYGSGKTLLERTQ